jgi:hypothetical protein
MQRLFFLCAFAFCCASPVYATEAMPRFANVIILPAPDADAEQQVHEAIVVAANSRGWKIMQDTPRNLRLRLIVRNQFAVVVNILVNIDMVDVEYVSSINMGYKKDAEGREFISPAYGKWVSRLLDAARQNVAPMSPAPATEPGAQTNTPGLPVVEFPGAESPTPSVQPDQPALP